MDYPGDRGFPSLDWKENWQNISGRFFSQNLIKLSVKPIVYNWSPWMRRQIALVGSVCQLWRWGESSKYENQKWPKKDFELWQFSIGKFYNLVLLETTSRSWNITVFVAYLKFTVGKERKSREREVLCSAKMPLKAKLKLFYLFENGSRERCFHLNFRESFREKRWIQFDIWMWEHHLLS